MYKTAKKTLSIIMMLTIILSAMPILTGSANESNLVELEGVVMDENNFKISHASVKIVNIHTGVIDELVTGEDGWFSFEVDEGSYLVSAGASGYINFNGLGTSSVIQVKSVDSSPLPVSLKLRQVPLTEAEKIVVNGTVVDPIDKGFPNATVSFRCTDPDYLGYTASVMTNFEHNETGQYSINLFKGNFHMVITAPVIEGEQNYRTIEENITFTTNTNITNRTLNPKAAELIDSVSGYIRDSVTKKYIDGIAYLYDWTNQVFLSSETSGKFFNIPAYTPGSFMLIVEADGYHPHYEYNIQLTDSNKFWSQELHLVPVGEEVIQTTIDFGSDWNTSRIDTIWTMNADSMIYGMEHTDKGDLRFNIDFESILWNGNRDKFVDNDELVAFRTYLRDSGPYHMTTKDFVKVNNTVYVANDKAGRPDFWLKTTNVNREITSSNVITIDTHTNYTLKDPVTQNSLQLEVGTLRENENLILKLPLNYEIAKWTPSDADIELVSFHEVKVMEDGVVFTANKVMGPMAEMRVTGDYLKPLQDIIFNGSDSTDDSGRGIENYTWDFADGNSGYGMSVVHNYTKPGEYNVTLIVTDSSELTETTYHIIKIDDAAPTPHFKLEDEVGNELETDGQGRYVADEDQLVFFNATMSTDTLDGSIPVELDPTTSFIWNFGDNLEPENGPEINHAYQFYSHEAHGDDNTFTVTLNVSDRSNNYKLLEKEILIRDKTSPTAIINPPLSVNIGESVEWNASGTEDNFDSPDNLTYSWDFGDNTTGTGKVVEHIYTTPGIYIAILNATDKGSNWQTTESSTVTIRGVNLAISNINFGKTKVDQGEKVTIQVNVTNGQFGQFSGADAYDIIVTLYDGDKVVGSQDIGYLAADEFDLVEFTWSGKNSGSNNLLANITLQNTTWELSWDDNIKDRTITVIEEDGGGGWIVVTLIIIVIIVFVLIFLKRRGIIGGKGLGKSSKDKKSGKKKGKKK